MTMASSDDSVGELITFISMSSAVCLETQTAYAVIKQEVSWAIQKYIQDNELIMPTITRLVQAIAA